MSLITTTQSFSVEQGMVEGVKVAWEGFSLLVVTAPKGFLGCGIFDLEALDRFGKAAAIVESTPDNPIGTLERLMERNVVAINQQAKTLGIAVGDSARDALEKMF